MLNDYNVWKLFVSLINQTKNWKSNVLNAEIEMKWVKNMNITEDNIAEL